MEKRVLIVNPVSGSGKSIEVSKKLEEIFKQQQIEYEILYTTQTGDAKDYAKNKVSDGSIIYSLGGDGTINEIANGIINTNKRLCVMPTGSGNDFYKTISAIKNDTLIDIVKVNDKYFINSFSIGIDSDICANANLFRKKYIPNSMIYKLSILYTLASYKSKVININAEKKDCTLLSITNGKYYGGGFKINPDAIVNDGLLDMILVDKKSKLEIISMLTKLLKGTHQNAPGVHSSKIKNLKIYSDVSLLACIDGEMIKDNKYDIAIIPSAIKLVQDEQIKQLIMK